MLWWVYIVSKVKSWSRNRKWPELLIKYRKLDGYKYERVSCIIYEYRHKMSWWFLCTYSPRNSVPTYSCVLYIYIYIYIHIHMNMFFGGLNGERWHVDFCIMWGILFQLNGIFFITYIHIVLAILLNISSITTSTTVTAAMCVSLTLFSCTYTVYIGRWVMLRWGNCILLYIYFELAFRYKNIYVLIMNFQSC